MKRVRMIFAFVICSVIVMGIAVAATTTGSGQHYGVSYSKTLNGTNATIAAIGNTSVAYTKSKNTCGSLRNVDSIVYEYNTSNVLLHSSTNSSSTSSTSWVNSGSIDRNATSYYRYYVHKCNMYIPTGNILSDTVQYTARQDQGY